LNKHDFMFKLQNTVTFLKLFAIYTNHELIRNLTGETHLYALSWQRNLYTCCYCQEPTCLQIRQYKYLIKIKSQYPTSSLPPLATARVLPSSPGRWSSQKITRLRKIRPGIQSALFAIQSNRWITYLFNVLF
jgi:hypothetical protein